MTPPPTQRKRSITTPMAIIGFVAGVVSVIIIVRYFF
jgi:hypothetical protein